MIRPSVALGLAISCAALAAGCSDKKPSSTWPDGLVPPDGPVFNDFVAQDLGVAPDLGGDKDGPVIEMLSPKDNQEVTGTLLNVQAKITDPLVVDDQSVTVTLKGGATAKMSMSTTPSVYEALLDVSSVSGGAMLWVQASNLEGKKSAKVVVFTRDPGPTIIISSPAEGSRHRASVSVQVLVIDTSKPIASFEAHIGTVALDLQKSVDEIKKQVWNGTIAFDDSRFSPALTGQQVITVTAANAGGASSTAQQSFVVDDQGPTIVPTSHKAGDLIGNVIKLAATVTDDAGVLPSSVICVVGNDLDTREVQLKLAAVGGTTYEGTFDTRTLTQYDLWPVMSFRAADTLGNQSHQDVQVGLDNGSPIVEMDPSTLYFHGVVKDGDLQCSLPFDPVGCDAASDKSMVAPIIKLRVRVEDQGNHVPSAQWVPVAAVDEGSVRLYVLDDTDQPLLVDTDGDGFCDDVNPEILPTASNPQPNAAVAVALASVPPSGKAFFPSVLPPGMPSGCSPGTDDPTKPPEPLCAATADVSCSDRMTVATETDYGDPAIFSIPPVAPGDKWECVGLPFDLKANAFQPGWVCAGVVAQDKLGNRGVSPPIRLWYDPTSTSPDQQPLPSGTPAAPGCTGTLDKATGKVDASKPCTYRGYDQPFPQIFAPGEILVQ